MRIPWSSVINYAKLYEIEGEELETFIYHIRKMDSFLLNRIDAKQKAKK